MTREQRGMNFRQTGTEARVALVAWLVTFAWVVSVSWWAGAERPAPLWFGIPQWVWLGPGIGWVGTLVFNCWFAVRMLGRAASSGVATYEKRGSR